MDDKCEYDHLNAMNKVMNEISQHGMDTIYLLAIYWSVLYLSL